MNFKELEVKLREYYDDFEELKFKDEVEDGNYIIYSFIAFRDKYKTFTLFTFETDSNKIYKVGYRTYDTSGYNNKIEHSYIIDNDLNITDKFFCQFIDMKYDCIDLDKK
jgi:hypothetical protein